MIKVVIIDDHPVLTNGLKNTFRETGNIVVTAVYNRAGTLLENMDNLDADVLILDMQLPDGNGYEIARTVLKAHSKMGILVFSSTDSVYQIKKMLQAGCLGYLLKNADNLLLLKAIGAVSEGYRFLSPELEKLLLDDMFASKQDTNKKVALTKRELEILALIVNEHTTQEIAAELFLTLSTIEFHRANMLHKLGVKNTAGLVRVAVQTGLVN